MRILFSCLFLLFAFVANAQIIDFRMQLFDPLGFFNKDSIKQNQIESIKITRSDKQDGRIFESEVSFLKFVFSRSGQILLSNKYVPLRSRVDTAVIQLRYNKENELIRKIEKQGPFQFDYFFYYKEGLLAKEVKVNGNSISTDTAYIRFYEHEISKREQKITVLNTAHIPFQTHFIRKDEGGKLVAKETQFKRNSNYHKITYQYQEDSLIAKQEENYRGKFKVNSWEFLYKNKRVDYIGLKNKTEQLKKYALLYENSLPTAIVERNIKDKEVILYKFYYTFFN